MSLPYMPLYVADYEGDTGHLSVEEDGAYIRLLRLCWRTPGCSIPDDPSWIIRMMRVDQATFDRVILPVLNEFFKRQKDRIVSPRLQAEWRKANSISKKRSEAGKKGGRPPNQLKNNDNEESKRQSKTKAKQKHLEPEPEPEPEPERKKGSSDNKESVINVDTADDEFSTTPKYAFEAKTIKLNAADLDRWKRAFSHVSLEAELWALDEWASANGKKWFPAVAAALAKKEREARDRVNAARERGTGPPRRISGDGRI